MFFLRKLRNRLFSGKNVVISDKIEACCCFNEISSKRQYVSIRSRKMLYFVFNNVAEIVVWCLFVLLLFIIYYYHSW